MPGAPLLFTTDSYQGVTGEGIPHGSVASSGSSASGLGWSFWVWVVVIGVVVPTLILGGLRAGGFQFVFKRR